MGYNFKISLTPNVKAQMSKLLPQIRPENSYERSSQDAIKLPNQASRQLKPGLEMRNSDAYRGSNYNSPRKSHGINSTIRDSYSKDSGDVVRTSISSKTKITNYDQLINSNITNTEVVRGNFPRRAGS